MNINGVTIEDTFAEAFEMRATRIVITAMDRNWVAHAAETMTGFATSVIGCGLEAGIEQYLEPEETPDGRPGVAVLLFAVSGKELTKHLQNRIGQSVLTCPTTAVFSGLDGEATPMGEGVRYFGDGYQISKLFGERRFWRVPVMDGEFVCEATTGRVNAVGGGNFLVLGRSAEETLRALEAAIEAMSRAPGIIMPFPGGVVRSGSKVGSKYKALPASTNDAYCPTLRGLTDSNIGPEVGAVMEVVIDGLDPDSVSRAMAMGIQTVCAFGPDNGILGITAGNFGGDLGQFQFSLHEVLA
ncbi:formylmethanofuran--tetrahydromethanopterin N-formyltransferase [Thiohalorhabdus methylotrophus]|uniref:Formylmethanofuran--tetrahydromethanopterin formyltransferase n=1 Tax=Thiohalorhabdus methylotrophus TaxID=3242694 RepID=A0ABV4TYF1_9GAMM